MNNEILFFVLGIIISIPLNIFSNAISDPIKNKFFYTIKLSKKRKSSTIKAEFQFITELKIDPVKASAYYRYSMLLIIRNLFFFVTSLLITNIFIYITETYYNITPEKPYVIIYIISCMVYFIANMIVLFNEFNIFKNIMYYDDYIKKVTNSLTELNDDT